MKRYQIIVQKTQGFLNLSKLSMRKKASYLLDLKPHKISQIEIKVAIISKNKQNRIIIQKARKMRILIEKPRFSIISHQILMII